MVISCQRVVPPLFQNRSSTTVHLPDLGSQARPHNLIQGSGITPPFHFWKKGKDPHPQDKSQHLDFTKDPRPLYYKTPPCEFYHKNVRSKAVFSP